MKRAYKPGRIRDPEVVRLMWRQGDGNSGSRGGAKAPNQLLVRAQYGGQVVELNLVDVALPNYNWHAFKSKVKSYQ